MPTITFIQNDGSEIKVEAAVGQSVMSAALDNQVPGILGDCGGSCSCATCHGYVDTSWQERVPAPEDYENDMLCCAMDVQDNSRLTCQITITEDMDGLVVHLPASQT